MLRFITLLGAGFALVTTSTAQSIESILPPAASPGTEIVIEGTGLDLLDGVQFRYQDSVISSTSGSAVSFQVVLVPVIDSPERLRVTVPAIPGSGSLAGFRLDGSIRGLVGGSPTASTPFGFLQVTGGDVRTVGRGSTQAGGGRAYTGFTLADGAPFQGFPIGVPTERIQLYGATPGADAVLYAGPIDPTFPAVLGDGNLAISRRRLVRLGDAVADANGRGEATVQIPGAGFLDVEIAFQWVLIDRSGAAPQVDIAQGLAVRI